MATITVSIETFGDMFDKVAREAISLFHDIYVQPGKRATVSFVFNDIRLEVTEHSTAMMLWEQYSAACDARRRPKMSA